MKIYLNGQITPTDCKNLIELIQYLALENKRYAIEFNSRIIPKSKLECTNISEFDRIEIIHAVGGG